MLKCWGGGFTCDEPACDPGIHIVKFPQWRVSGSFGLEMIFGASMGLVTRLVQSLPGQILLSVHIGNFNPVDWNKI